MTFLKAILLVTILLGIQAIERSSLLDAQARVLSQERALADEELVVIDIPTTCLVKMSAVLQHNSGISTEVVTEGTTDYL